MLNSLNDKLIDIQFILQCETFHTESNTDRWRYNIYYRNLIYIEQSDICINIEGQFECIAAEIKSHSGMKILIKAPNTSELNSILPIMRK